MTTPLSRMGRVTQMTHMEERNEQIMRHSSDKIALCIISLARQFLYTLSIEARQDIARDTNFKPFFKKRCFSFFKRFDQAFSWYVAMQFFHIFSLIPFVGLVSYGFHTLRTIFLSFMNTCVRNVDMLALNTNIV